MAFAAGSSTNRLTLKSEHGSHQSLNGTRQVKRTSGGLKIAPSADIAHVAPYQVYENFVPISSKTSHQSSSIPIKPSSSSAKAIYRNKSNFNSTGSRREIIVTEKHNQHQLNIDPYSTIGREEMNIHEHTQPKTIFQMGKIFDAEAMKRSSS